MAGWGASGALLLVLLIGGNNCIPIKGGGGGNGGAGDDGKGGGGSDSGGGVIYSQPGEFAGVAAPVGSGAFVGGRFLDSSVYQNTGQPASQGQSWIVEPAGPDAQSAASSLIGPGDAGFGAGGPTSLYQPGELSHMQNTFEHGNYDTETETQGIPVNGPGILPGDPIPVEPGDGIGNVSPIYPYPGPGGPYYGGYRPYPYWDWRFLTGQYPPGLVSHFSSDFEQGRDSYHDAYYNKFYPGDPSGPGGDDGQQVKQIPGTPGKKLQYGA